MMLVALGSRLVSFCLHLVEIIAAHVAELTQGLNGDAGVPLRPISSKHSHELQTTGENLHRLPVLNAARTVAGMLVCTHCCFAAHDASWSAASLPTLPE